MPEFVRCATIGCECEAVYVITYPGFDGLEIESCCETCTLSYLHRPSLKVESCVKLHLDPHHEARCSVQYSAAYDCSCDYSRGGF